MLHRGMTWLQHVEAEGQKALPLQNQELISFSRNIFTGLRRPGDFSSLLGPNGHTSEDEWCIIEALSDTHLERENSLNSIQQPVCLVDRCLCFIEHSYVLSALLPSDALSITTGNVWESEGEPVD